MTKRVKLQLTTTRLYFLISLCRVCFFRYLLYFIISILSGLFLRFCGSQKKKNDEGEQRQKHHRRQRWRGPSGQAAEAGTTTANTRSASQPRRGARFRPVVGERRVERGSGSGGESSRILTLVVLYLLMPGMPLPFCSVHSNVTMTRTCFPFFAMQVTCLVGAAVLLTVERVSALCKLPTTILLLPP